MIKTFTNETELLQGINEKNIQALNKFLVPLHAKATYIAYTIVKDNHAAIQVVNDAHLAFMKTPAIFESLQKAESYFYTSTRNKALNYIDSADHKKWNNVTHEIPEISDGNDPVTAYAKKEIQKKMLATIDTLPKKQQRIFKLIIDGYKTEEIANEIGKGKKYVLNTKIKIFKKTAAILKKLIMLL